MEINSFVNYYFCGKIFRCRWAYHKPAQANVLVGPSSLDKLLKLHDYSGEAKKVDEDIYCYVDDNILYSKQAVLDKYLEENFD